MRYELRSCYKKLFVYNLINLNQSGKDRTSPEPGTILSVLPKNKLFSAYTR